MQQEQVSLSRPDRSRARLIFIVVVVAMTAATVAGLAFLLALLFQGPGNPGVAPSAAPSAAPTNISQLASPLAREPLECEGQCFEVEFVDEFLTDDTAFRAIGLDSTTEPWGFRDPATVAELYSAHLDFWAGFDQYTADNCIFVPSSAPYISHRYEGWSTSTDTVNYLVTHEDEARENLGDMSVRHFESTWAASSYLRELGTSVESCMTPVSGYGLTVNVLPLPQLDLPDAVASVGWVASNSEHEAHRTYVADLQRGNVVVRLRVLTDGLISEQQFLTLVETYATQDLDVVVPTGRVIAE